MKKQPIARWGDLEPSKPAHALVASVDLVVARDPRTGADHVSVLHGRGLHRDALMADGHVDGPNLICGGHGWEDRVDTGISEYNNAERLHKSNAWIEPADDAMPSAPQPTAGEGMGL